MKSDNNGRDNGLHWQEDRDCHYIDISLPRRGIRCPFNWCPNRDITIRWITVQELTIAAQW